MADDGNTLHGEIWKPIPWSDGYSVSNMGRFRADIRTSRNWLPGLRKSQPVGKFRHHAIKFLVNGKMENHLLHRVILTVFVGPPPTPDHQGAHNDGNPANNRLDNLRWATPKENNADKIAHGTLPLGERMHSSKLTDEQVRYIRQCDLSGSKLGAMFGVTRRTIDRARSGEGWTHIDTPPKRNPQGGRHY